MNKQDKEALMWIGGLALLGWLLSREQFKCPRCNNPLIKNAPVCPNCGQPLVWGVKK